MIVCTIILQIAEKFYSACSTKNILIPVIEEYWEGTEFLLNMMTIVSSTLTRFRALSKTSLKSSWYEVWWGGLPSQTQKCRDIWIWPARYIFISKLPILQFFPCVCTGWIHLLLEKENILESGQGSPFGSMMWGGALWFWMGAPHLRSIFLGKVARR